MCGIFACLSCGGGLHPCLKKEVIAKLKRRGPDATNEVDIDASPPSSLRLNLIGTLLQMRGDSTPQPLLAKLSYHVNNYLLWNGNVFGGDIEVAPNENDTVKLMQELVKHEDSPSGILSTLSRIHGPWAFVYWQESTHSLWFGRDTFGRRSLLWHTPRPEEGRDGLFILSSVGHYHEKDMPLGYWTEVPANGLYQLQCKNGMEAGELQCFPWMQGDKLYQSETSIKEDLSSLSTYFTFKITPNEKLQAPFPPFNALAPTPLLVGGCLKEHPISLDKGDDAAKGDKKTSSEETKRIDGLIDTHSEIETSEVDCSGEDSDLSHSKFTVSSSITASHPPPVNTDMLSLAHQFLSVLEQAVSIRVLRAPMLPSRISSSHKHNHKDQSLLESSAMGEVKHFCHKSNTGLYPPVPEENSSKHDQAKNSSDADCLVNDPSATMETNVIAEEISTLNRMKLSDLSCDMEKVKVKEKACDLSERLIEGNARIAILFSGGVDSTVLAALTDRCLDPDEEIDLINVAFEQKPTSTKGRFDVPDRITALESLAELNPSRQWNLIMVNVSLEEVNQIRKTRVSHMVYPLCTVLDDSIGCALWFAARGEGLLYTDHTPNVMYHSQARTLFVGIGADEQLAGYSRHRTKFKSLGWTGLTDELEMDIKRLSKRNLGRDDRCIADHHREGQFPFLDERVVSFLQNLPVWEKADLTLPRGHGEKLLLRQVSCLLGCRGASQLPKRAIQFGSRIAKMAGTGENKVQGSNVCTGLLPGQ